MVNRLKPLNLFDFTGGINLRPETFQLKDNEVPDLLNMEVDPRGGINTRNGWTGFGPKATTATWNPRSAYAHTRSTGERIWMVANKPGATGQVLSRTSIGAWTNVGDGTANATPHTADYVAWGDDVYVVRGTAQSLRWDGTTATLLTTSAAANWQNDYAAPGATDTFPLGQLVEQQNGYMFVAGTNEDGVARPNRVRWSHPNNPRRWAQADYVDITDGGQRITAIVAFSDRLLVFKPDSVWALFGYDADTWEMTNISRTVGCWSQQAICRNESAVFFLSWPQGIFGYTERGGIVELSVPIRTVFQDKKMDPDAIDNSWLGWVGRRLWCSLPYLDDPPPPQDACTVFVFDPSLSEPGSWVMFRGAEQLPPGMPLVPGPYMERTDADQNTPLIACGRRFAYLLQLEANASNAKDEQPPGTPLAFATRFRTKWLDAGAPTWRKSWRRPDFLLRGMTFDTAVNVQVFHDLDNYNAERSFVVTYTPDNFLAVYGTDGVRPHFVWGDGTLYGGSDQTSSVERGGTMGRAGAVQLLCVGAAGVTWGLNGIIFKFVPRRFR